MYSKWASKGFSIAELMIVIVVIAILAGIVVVSYSGFQERARDSQRTSHVAQLKIALDKYYANNSQFPAVCVADDTACDVQGLATSLAPYLNDIPSDPKYGDNVTESYQYIRGGTSGNAYGIKVMYEIETACIEGVRISGTWWSGTYPEC